MIIQPEPGLYLDQPVLSPQARWQSGFNIRFRLGRLETIGLFGPLRNPAGTQVDLPGSGVYRSLFVSPSTTTGQILAGSATNLTLLQFDPGSSTPGAPARWATFDITPSGMSGADDTVTDPSAGRVEIPPVWWFSDQDDVIVGNRAGVATDPCYYWDRNSANDAQPLTDAPEGAVGGGIINRILVLLGVPSFDPAGPGAAMTIRWSARLDFEDWTPTDINASGELQLEGGSRIVGGGIASFGVVAWTDKRMAILTETFNLDSVFNREYVVGARGMLANRAWCEADGVIWWLDEARVLNAYDGGRARQFPNPLKAATFERITDKEAARIYMAANPEFSEVLIWFPSGSGVVECDACVVFNYVENAWSYWSMTRTAWCQRFGVIPNLAVGPTGLVYRHDLDVSIPAPWVTGLTAAYIPPVADVLPFDFEARTNLIVTENVSTTAWKVDAITVDHIPSPAVGAEDDVIEVAAIAYGKATMTSDTYEDAVEMEQGQDMIDVRAEGKALQFRIRGEEQKTVWRIGAIDINPTEEGER